MIQNKIVAIPFPLTERKFKEDVLLFGNGVGSLEANYTLVRQFLEEQAREVCFIHLNFYGQPRTLEDIEAVILYNDSPVLQLVDLNAKMDLIVQLSMKDHPELNTSQIQATAFILTKCDKILEFVRLSRLFVGK